MQCLFAWTFLWKKYSTLYFYLFFSGFLLGSFWKCKLFVVEFCLISFLILTSANPLHSVDKKPAKANKIFQLFIIHLIVFPLFFYLHNIKLNKINTKRKLLLFSHHKVPQIIVLERKKKQFLQWNCSLKIYMKNVALMIFIYIFLLFLFCEFLSHQEISVCLLWNFILLERPLILICLVFLYVQVGCYFSFLKMCYRHGIHEPTDSKDAMLLMFEWKLLPHTSREEGESKYNAPSTKHANNGRASMSESEKRDARVKNWGSSNDFASM